MLKCSQPTTVALRADLGVCLGNRPKRQRCKSRNDHPVPRIAGAACEVSPGPTRAVATHCWAEGFFDGQKSRYTTLAQEAPRRLAPRPMRALHVLCVSPPSSPHDRCVLYTCYVFLNHPRPTTDACFTRAMFFSATLSRPASDFAPAHPRLAPAPPTQSIL